MKAGAVLGILCLLYIVEAVEYQRSGSCNFSRECLYKYHTAQYTFGEKDRENFYFSADVQWHCESSGVFGNQTATEYCLTLINPNVTFSADFNSRSTVKHRTNAEAAFLSDKLKGEYCFVQTQNGKIVSIHYSHTESEEGINIKRGITGAFQGSFDSQEEVEELDPGSTHISHYSFAKTSSNVISFTRTFKTGDLIEINGGGPKDSLNYTKTEKSIFINKILYRSLGMLKVRFDFGNKQGSGSSSDTFNPNLKFGDEFQANGTYMLERVYCKKRSKRSLIFAELSSSSVQKGSLTATVDLATADQYRIRKIKSSIYSIPGYLEKIRRNSSNTELVDKLLDLVRLEAKYDLPSQYTPAISEIVEYYKQIQSSSKPENVEIRKIIYCFFSADGGILSQKVLASALSSKLSEDERNVLLYQIALIKSAKPDLVNTVISSIRGNDDNGAILVLGGLGRNSNVTIEKAVVNELFKRLNAITPSSNKGAVTTLIYALGNSRSKLALLPILSTLQYDDIDIQISAIRSLAFHLDQPVVQQAIITLLPLTDEDKILEEILKILIDAFENKILTNPRKDLIKNIIKSAIELENPILYELVAKYLHHLKFDWVDVYLDLLKQQHNYGDIQHDRVSDLYYDESRIKRGSDWDENNPDYDVVASYSQRKSDVINYPNHNAYIWGKTFGVDELNMKVGVGAFAGINISLANLGFNFFCKAAAKTTVFGESMPIVDIEASGYNQNNSLVHKLYLKLGNSVQVHDIRNIGSKIDNVKDTFNAATNNVVIFYSAWQRFIYVGILTVYIKGTVSAKLGSSIFANMYFLPPTLKGSADTKLSFILRVTGGASASLALLVQGGIEIAANFSYYVQPKLSADGILEFSNTSSDLEVNNGSGFNANSEPGIEVNDGSGVEINSESGSEIINGSGIDVNVNSGPDMQTSRNVSTINITTCALLYHDFEVIGEIYPWYQFKHVHHMSWSGIKTAWGPKYKWNNLYRKWNLLGLHSLLWSSCPS